VAAKAVDLYRGIGMTALAELSLRVHRHESTLGILICVTINASHQAVPRGANTLVHGFVALVFEKFEVIPTHDIYRLDTLFATCTGKQRLADFCKGSGQTDTPQQAYSDHDCPHGATSPLEPVLD
jgi:hypothetical protein